jgi:uncharacterized protein YggE
MLQVPNSQPVNTANSQVQKFKSFFQTNKNRFIAVFIIVGTLFLLKQIFFQSALISVVGTGRLTAKPEKVEMLVTQVDSNPDPVIAVSNSEKSIEKLITKAKTLTGDDIEIQKSFYQMTPSVMTGDVLYQVVNVFKVTANDPAKASDLIKMFYSEGATTVSNVNFIPENQDQVTQEARKAAIKKAREEAKNIAKASGKRLGRIVSIGDDLIDANSTVSTDASMTEGEETAQVNYINGVPSELDIAKSMTVTYEIW